MIDMLHIRLNSSGIAANLRLLVRNLAGAILAQGTVPAGDNVTRSVAVPAFPAVQAQRYWMCVSQNAGSILPYQNNVQGSVGFDTSSTYAAPEANFVVDSSPAALRQFQMWATGIVSKFPTISSVNGGNPVKIGSTVSFNRLNFTKAITKGTIDGIALAAATNDSITLPAALDMQLIPRPGASRVLELSSADNTEKATFNIVIEPPLGLSAQEILAGFKTGERDSIVYNFDPPMVAGRSIFFDPTKGTVGADASYSGTFTGTQTMVDYDPVSKIGRVFYLITGEDGGVIDVKHGFKAVLFAATFFKAKPLLAKSF